jgi:hypothetical protein
VYDSEGMLTRGRERSGGRTGLDGMGKWRRYTNPLFRHEGCPPASAHHSGKLPPIALMGDSSTMAGLARGGGGGGGLGSS